MRPKHTSARKPQVCAQSIRLRANHKYAPKAHVCAQTISMRPKHTSAPDSECATLIRYHAALLAPDNAHLARPRLAVALTTTDSRREWTVDFRKPRRRAVCIMASPFFPSSNWGFPFHRVFRGSRKKKQRRRPKKKLRLTGAAEGGRQRRSGRR